MPIIELDYLIQSIGISWYNPFGKIRLMEIGRARASNSAVAIEIVSGILLFHEIKDGAPSVSCRDLAPVILALSNRVSLGGPIST